MEQLSIQDKYLWHITKEGVTAKYGDNPPQDIIDRISMEMDVITHNNFTDYILIIWDIHDFCRSEERVSKFCKENGIEPPPDNLIPLGPGRGSVGGSLVCYCIGIHECDPIRFGLHFERFLNPERIAYPDIDFDISQRYRHIVLAYISKTYGSEHVAQIITYSTLSAKSVVDEVLKSAGVPSSTIQTVKETIPSDPEIMIADLKDNDRFMKAMMAIPFPNIQFQVTPTNAHKIRSLDRIDPKYWDAIREIQGGKPNTITIEVQSSWNYDKAIHIMSRLEKLSKHESVHSGGVVVSPVTLEDNIPLMKKKENTSLSSQYDMVMLEYLGYLKMDALGLRTVDVNHDAERLVRKWYDTNFSIRKIPYNDKNAIDLIHRGDTIGIFQIESSGFTQMMGDIFDASDWNRQQKNMVEQIEGMDIEIEDFMWIVAGLAMYRPGPLDAVVEGKTMVQHIIDRKAGKEPVIYLFPEEAQYLGDTYGVMIYQEQVMSRVRQMTGCTYGRADMLRRAMGKKDPVEMKKQMEWFEEHASKHDFTSQPMNDIQRKNIIQRAIDEIDKFARYGFNKAHAVEYAHICYRNAYLKSNYPVAFYTALLNSEMGNSKRQPVIIRDMMKNGIELLPPLINQSGLLFTMTDKHIIRFGLGAIKGLGDKALQAIFEDHQQRGDFKSVEDFRARVPATLCNVQAMTNLAKCGAFDHMLDKCLHPMKNRATLVESMKGLNNTINKLKQKKGKKSAPSIEEVVWKINNGHVMYPLVEADEDLIEYATWEKQVLNYFISAHPMDAYTGEIERWTAIQDTEMEDLPSEFYIAGFLAAYHETTIKKEGRNKGKKMGFVTIETEFRSYEATMFPGIWESCLPYMKVGNAVVLKGKRDNYRGKVSVQGLYMRHLINSGIRDCPECHIRLNESNVFDIMQLKQMFDQHPGMTQVYIHITVKHYDITIQCNQSVALNDRIIDFCNQIGKIAYKPI